MPHIEVDLDGMKRVPAMAGVLGLSVPQTQGGLVLLWNWCWTEKTDHVRSVQLGGLFATQKHQDLATCLIEFGFLEEQAEGWFRVRGAERYLRLGLGKTMGGKARVQGAKRDALGRLLPSSKVKNTSSEPSSRNGNAGPAAQQKPSSTTDHRTPITDHRRSDLAGSKNPEPAAAVSLQPGQGDLLGVHPAPKSKRQNEKREPDPRLRALQAELEADYEQIRGERYAHRGAADTEAVKALLLLGDNPKIRARWCESLRLPRSDWCSTSNWGQLRSKWNDLAAPSAHAAKSHSVDPPKLVIATTEQAQAWSKENNDGYSLADGHD